MNLLTLQQKTNIDVKFVILVKKQLKKYYGIWINNKCQEVICLSEQSIKNLVSFGDIPKDKHHEISVKGGIMCSIKKKEKKKIKEQNERLVDILKELLFSEIKSKKLKDEIKKLGFEGNSYFVAMCATSVIKVLKKGDFNILLKLVELVDSSNENGKVESKAFNNLIGAIKSVRKTEPETD